MLAGELVGLLLVEVRQRALLRAPAQRVDVATSIVRRRSFPGCRAAVSRGSSIDPRPARLLKVDSQYAINSCHSSLTHS